MTASSSFDGFLVDLAANDPAAAERMSREAFRRLVGWVRGHIGARYRSKVDADSVINSAVRAVLERHAVDPYELGGWDDLWALLAEVARCKLSNHLRRFRGKGRDVALEVAASAAAESPSPAAAPDADAILDDLLRHLLTGYSDAERAVIDLSLHGHTVEEIAAELGRKSRTVLRIRRRFRDRVEVEQARGSAG